MATPLPFFADQPAPARPTAPEPAAPAGPRPSDMLFGHGAQPRGVSLPSDDYGWRPLQGQARRLEISPEAEEKLFTVVALVLVVSLLTATLMGAL